MYCASYCCEVVSAEANPIIISVIVPWVKCSSTRCIQLADRLSYYVTEHSQEKKILTQKKIIYLFQEKSYLKNQDLTFDKRVDNVCKKPTQRIGLLRSIIYVLPE